MAHLEPTTSAFGRRAVTRAQLLAQIAVKQARGAARNVLTSEAATPSGAQAGAGAVHKWTLLRTLSEIRDGLGLSDRALGVLSALLSFHPETALTLAAQGGQGETIANADRGETRPDHDDIGRDACAGLVVFPSNRALGLRCNGMSEATLRRHLAALVEAGLIIRRDSPNGKRFARREADGEGVAQAFGFDLAPLVARAPEFEARLESVQAERRRARLLKERVNLLRRDLTKRLAFALDEALPGPWERLRLEFLALCTPLRKLRPLADVEALAAELDALQDRVAQALEDALAASAPAQERQADVIQSGDAAHFGRRITESNTEQISDLEPASEKAGRGNAAGPEGGEPEIRPVPLGLVLQACPDIVEYEFSGRRIEHWRDLIAVAAAVRPMLGVSPDAWREAVETMGEAGAATAIAFILQRCEHSSQAERSVGSDGRAVVTVEGSPAIRSPGGYLRALTQKAQAEPRLLWSAVLGQLSQRGKSRLAPRAGSSAQ